MLGEDVKYSIKLAGKTQEEVAKSIGITREHLQKMLTRDIPDHYVEKIKLLGIEIKKKENKSDKMSPSPELQEDMIKLIMKSLDASIEENRVYRHIVDIVIKSGALKVDNVDKLKEQLK